MVGLSFFGGMTSKAFQLAFNMTIQLIHEEFDQKFRRMLADLKPGEPFSPFINYSRPLSPHERQQIENIFRAKAAALQASLSEKVKGDFASRGMVATKYNLDQFAVQFINSRVKKALAWVRGLAADFAGDSVRRQEPLKSQDCANTKAATGSERTEKATAKGKTKTPGKRGRKQENDRTVDKGIYDEWKRYCDECKRRNAGRPKYTDFERRKSYDEHTAARAVKRHLSREA
jgi:hypothetical protein